MVLRKSLASCSGYIDFPSADSLHMEEHAGGSLLQNTWNSNRPTLPSTRWQSSFRRRGTPASNIAYIHRCSIPNRFGTRLDYESDKRGPHSGWIAVCPHLPAYGTDALTSWRA